ncbi:hypothetical protein HDV03_001468 [Kappamyces sp. JEL0829]|nr:hypothetical protein HDV03_001468 [Kappamyces sp. JEL0829]
MRNDETIEMDSQPKHKVIANNVKDRAKKGAKAVGSVASDFGVFLSRGNAIDLAVGIIIGAAFTAVVNSFVKDLVTPFISLALDSVSLSDAYVVLACPKDKANGTRPSRSQCASQLTTITQANTLGAITWNYGNFLNNCLTFVVTGMVVYFLVRSFAAIFRKPPPAAVKECLHCCKEVPIKATRCAFCTSPLHE